MMASIEEILSEMANNPKGVRFTDACKVATHFFGQPRHNGTSYKVWKMPWPGDPRVNLQTGEGGKAKPYQVRQALAATDRLLSQHQPTERGRRRRRPRQRSDQRRDSPT